jgi:hypothetical protein
VTICTRERNLSEPTAGDFVTLRICVLASTEDSHGKFRVLSAGHDHLTQRAAARRLAPNTVLRFFRLVPSSIQGIWCRIPLGYAVSSRRSHAVKHRIAVSVQFVDSRWLWWGLHSISLKALLVLSLLARGDGDYGLERHNIL